jgi:diacylglycerol kinase
MYMIRLLRSFRWAGQGLRYCAQQEKNFQLHCCIAVLVIITGFILDISLSEWIVITICIAAILAFEMFNTAIEHLCNIVQPSLHPTVKVIKDVCAGAVLLIALMSVVCGAIIFIPKIVAFF